MATRTWKLGEISRGGVITAKVKGANVTVIAKDWDTSAGWSRGRSQANAEEWDRLELDINDRSFGPELSNYLNDLTTSYYADKITDWIESKVTKTKASWEW